MSRHVHNIDANQHELVALMRKLGAVVVSTAALGGGFPDLLVWHRGRTFLVEVKDGSKPPSARQLTPAQVRFHAMWPGELHVIATTDQVVALLQPSRSP